MKSALGKFFEIRIIETAQFYYFDIICLIKK